MAEFLGLFSKCVVFEYQGMSVAYEAIPPIELSKSRERTPIYSHSSGLVGPSKRHPDVHRNGTQLEKQDYLSHSYIAGIDEAGRGPVLGPLVYGICCSSSEETLKYIGVAGTSFRMVGMIT